MQGPRVKRGNPKKINEVTDPARNDILFANRQPGSGTRFLFDTLLKDRGVKNRVDCIPLMDEDYDLPVAGEFPEDERLAHLLELILRQDSGPGSKRWAATPHKETGRIEYVDK